MAKLFNRAKMTTATTGSGTVTLGSASNGFQTFAAAGVSNGDVVQYVIEENSNFEIGVGTYSSTGTSLTRSPTESSNSNAAITLAGQATVSITAVADDLNRLQHGGSDKVTVSSTGASVTGNLAVSGTVDGRDVASDGSKLDGIESGATADQTAAEIRSLVESASDSNVFTDADHTKLNGIEANAKNDQTITAGGGLTGGGTGDVTLSHSDTSSQASVNGSGRTYIQDITLDTYGHVTGLATASETVVNTNTIPNNATITLSAGGALTGGGNFTTDQSSNETITFNHSDTSSQGSVNNSGRTYIQDITLDGYGHVTGINSASETVTNTNTNQLTTFQVEDGDGTEVTISHGKEWKFVEGTAIDINWTNTSTGSDADPFDLTISHTDTSTLSGTYGSTSNSNKIDQITVDAQGHVTAITTGGTGSMSNFNVQANGGTQVSITNGEEVNFVNGNGTTAVVVNQANPTVTFHHNDTSSQASVNNSGRTYIQDITLDTYGHITGITSGTETVVNTDTNTTYSAGTNLSLSGTTFNVSANPSFTDVYVDDQIFSTGDTDTYLQFHAANQFRIVTGGTEMFEVNDSNIIFSCSASFGSNTINDVEDIYLRDRIYHDGDTNTYMQFQSADQWRVVVGGSERLEVKNSSPHVLVSGDLNSTSDERLKKNIKPIDNALADICQLEGVTFDWRDTGTQGQGFIAQQVEPIIPDVVNTDEDTGMKSVNYVGLIGHLVEAIKEQQTQIDDLKAEIQSMKS